jgi:fused signal recognition particle receptor
METANNNDILLLILLGGAIILGIVLTIAYYFARYGIKSPGVEERQELPPSDLQPIPEAEKPPLELLKIPGPDRAPPADEAVSRAEGAAPSAPKVEGPAPELEPGAPRAGKPVPAKELPPKTLGAALANTRDSIWGRLKALVGAGGLAPEIQDEIEEVLYTSDLGVATVERLMEALKKSSNGAAASSEKVRAILKEEMLSILGGKVVSDNSSVLAALNADKPAAKPTVWLIVGVNGAGKTTTIGKLAYLLAQSGKRVMVAAGDTFRAAAGEQLKIWTERAQVEIFAPEGVMDPAAVAYQALEKAKGQGFDFVIIDTAGRLHTQKNLMEELKKVKRVMTKLDPQAPHETLLVLDANSGQNAIVQAREFNGALDLTGVVLTKMDGTAKGGVALSLAVELNLPPKLIGVGEKVTDLRPFVAEEFVNAIL